MQLNQLKFFPGSSSKSKRLGRGIGSGKGKTCARGVKGQKSRSGVSTKYCGKKDDIFKILPKRGFSSRVKKPSVITTSQIKYFQDLGCFTNNNIVSKSLLSYLGLLKDPHKECKIIGDPSLLSQNIKFKIDKSSKNLNSYII